MKTVDRKWQVVNGEKLSAVSGQRRVKQVLRQLTDQMCELLEGIRCADSLAMFYVLRQEATALTMKSTKGLKEGPHWPGTWKIEAPHFFMLFMVDWLVWRRLLSFMVGRVRSHSSVSRRSEVSTPLKDWRSGWSLHVLRFHRTLRCREFTHAG